MASELTTTGASLRRDELQLLTALVNAYHPNHFLTLGSPVAPPVAQIHASVGSDFDFVLWDGAPSYEGCLADIDEALPFLDEGNAYLLVHHAANVGVAAAIDDALAAHPEELHDCGLVGRTAVWDVQRQTHYGGLRLLRYTRRRRLTVWQEGA